jgi:hypothetical protein
LNFIIVPDLGEALIGEPIKLCLSLFYVALSVLNPILGPGYHSKRGDKND